jgi:hypothetical protein
MNRKRQRNADHSRQEELYGRGMSRSGGSGERTLRDEDIDDFDDQYDEDDVEDVEFGNRRLLGGGNRSEGWNQGIGKRGRSGFRENKERSQDYWNKFCQKHPSWWEYSGQGNVFGQPYGQSQGSQQERPDIQQDWRGQETQFNSYGQFGNSGQHNQPHLNQPYGQDRGRRSRGPWSQEKSGQTDTRNEEGDYDLEGIGSQQENN